jgi:hypothetical protein
VTRHRPAAPTTMVVRIALALAKAEGQALTADPLRYRRLAVASLKPLTVPSEAMIDTPIS